MPAYNAADTIESAIRSVLCQTFGNLELLIGDDASTDDTSIRVANISDERIKLIKSNRNVGSGALRDRLMEDAVGQWITLCDADDIWHPKRLEALLDATGNDERLIAFDNIMRCHSNMVPWKPLRKPSAFGNRGKAVTIEAHQLISSPSMLIQPMFSRSLLLESGARHGSQACGEDTHFFLKLLLATQKLVYVPTPYYLYRTTPGSASNNNDRHAILLRVLESAVRDFKNHPAIQKALNKQIQFRRHEARYLPFATAIKQRNFAAATALSLRSPSLVADFIARGVRELPYQLHRIRHGGRMRSSKQERSSSTKASS